jgi:glyoxylate/hydroxypyruvate reductase
MRLQRSGYRTQTGPVRIHFENSSALGPVFEVTEERIADALARNPELNGKVVHTLGQDGHRIDEALREAEILFAWRFPRERIALVAPKLRWVHAHGAGVEHLRPFDWLPEQAVLTNSRGVHGERANEYLLMALLMLNNRVPSMVSNQARCQWVQLFNTAIGGKTLLIVGVGHLGGGAAEYAKKVGLKVIGVRRTGQPHPHVDEMYTTKDLPNLLPHADFVICSTPLTRDTKDLIGRRELDLMKPTAGLINVGRAEIVDYQALADKLHKGELSGAVIDVTAPEPLPSDSPLWNVPNLIITPHSSSDDTDYYTPRTLDHFLANVVRFIRGEPLSNVVDRELEY